MWYIIMSCFETLVSPIFFTYPIGLRAPGRTPEHTWTDIDITAGQGRPSAMDASTNYYLLLGIFDPDDDLSGTSDADPEVMESIRHAISDKQLESGRASRNPRKAIQLEGKRRLDLLQHAETALDTQAKRERQFDEALAIVDTAMAKHVGNFASKGFIAAPEIGLIVDRIADETGYAPTPITVRSFARRKHIDIRRTAAPSDALKPIEPPKPDPSTTMRRSVRISTSAAWTTCTHSSAAARRPAGTSRRSSCAATPANGSRRCRASTIR